MPIPATRYPAQVTASQQRAALLLHDAEVGDDGPDDEKDEEQASWLGLGFGFGFGFGVRITVTVSRPPVAEARKTGEMPASAMVSSVGSVGMVCGLGLGLGFRLGLPPPEAIGEEGGVGRARGCG